MSTLNDAEQVTKEIFGNSFVHIEKVHNPEIRHVYLNQEATMDQSDELEKHYQILFSSRTYEEDEKQIGKKCRVVILISELEEKKENSKTIKSLKSLIKEISEIPDGEVDRWLIIDEIKKIIKEDRS